MITSRHEHTIAVSCEITGRGYWSGRQATVTIHPAPAMTGVRLIRSDLPTRPGCPALATHRDPVPLRTNLVSGLARFQMVEHLMAALAALEIDNCLIEVDAEELPALDGSSAGYVDHLRGAGLIVQARARHRLVIQNRHRVGTPEAWIEAAPPSARESYFEYQLSFKDDAPIRSQSFGIELTPDRFSRDVAAARTFVTLEQADQIRAAGLASHVTNQDLLVIGPDGPIDNAYRFDNECARHKTLDMIGDLALAGVDLVGRFTSFRGGHQLNGQMASHLAELAQQQLPASNPAVFFCDSDDQREAA